MGLCRSHLFYVLPIFPFAGTSKLGIDFLIPCGHCLLKHISSGLLLQQACGGESNPVPAKKHGAYMKYRWYIITTTILSQLRSMVHI